MVLPCVIYGLEESTFYQLMTQLSNVSKQTETLFRIELYTQKAQDVLHTLEQTVGVALWIVGINDIYSDEGMMSVQMGRRVLQKNRDHYIVYVVKDRVSMEQVSPFCVRPAGLLTAGAIEKGGEILFRNIMLDFHKLYGMETKSEKGWLYLKSQGTMNRIHLDDVCMVQALNKKIEIHTNSQVLTVYASMDNMAEQLDERFVRCHRSYFVNREMIQFVDFRNFCIQLMDGSTVPFARSFRKVMTGLADKENVMAEMPTGG